MMDKVDVLCFSPTGGTRRVSEALGEGLAREVVYVDLCDRDGPADPGDELAVIAVPVFGGRVPSTAAERIGSLDGHGRTAVTVVVYGTRAYEDALLELNDIATGCGFSVVASGAFVAEHSIVRTVGPGRPDAEDMEDVGRFAEDVLSKLSQGRSTCPEVPGNRPYRVGFKAPATPVTGDGCTLCGSCGRVCPTGAVAVSGDGVVTELSLCLMCMACVSRCPEGVRDLPAAVRESTESHLNGLVGVRRPNETFLRRELA